MAIVLDTSSASAASAATSVVIGIGGATVGSVVFLVITVAQIQSTNITLAGWNSISEADFTGTGGGIHYGVWWRRKQTGDTNFTASWPNANGMSWAWGSFRGVALLPYEGLQVRTQGALTSFATLASTPGGPGRWVVALFGAGGGTTGTFSLAASPISLDLGNVNSTGAANFACTSFQESQGNVVSQTSQSYTSTYSVTPQAGFTAIFFITPFTNAAPSVVSQAVRRSASY